MAGRGFYHHFYRALCAGFMHGLEIAAPANPAFVDRPNRRVTKVQKHLSLLPAEKVRIAPIRDDDSRIFADQFESKL